MATRLTLALSAAVAVAVSGVAAGVYSFEPRRGWLRSGLDATAADANAQAGESITIGTQARFAADS